jgi:hypothetical protein
MDTLFNQYPIIPFGLFVFVVYLFISQRRAMRVKRVADVIDQVLYWWTPNDPYRVRDLLNGGTLILGRSGSGKTSSSGRTLMRKIVENPNSGGLILAATPQDAGDVRAVFEKAGRLNDLIVFSADGPRRTNFLQWLGRGQTRNVVQALMMIGQSLQSGSSKSKNDEQFWVQLNERYFYNSVAALQAAGEPITPDRLLKFLMTAATSPEQQKSEEWQRGYHNRVMEKASAREKTQLEEHDFKLCLDFWVHEFPFMDPRTRGNGMAGVMNILHTFCTGIVREMVASDEPNVTPDAVLQGQWLVVDFAPSEWHAVGSLICAGWKYLTQLAVLQRKATEASPFVTIWCDEAHQFVNDFDSHYIAQCRSHRGCLIQLTQSVNSFYSKLKGREGEAEANALLANFSTIIVHICDPITAKWACDKLGKRKEILFSGSSQTADTVWDQLFGKQRYTGSFAEHYESTLQSQEFMVGRTGGEENGYVADAIVIRSGSLFSDGKAFQRVAFSQRQ